MAAAAVPLPPVAVAAVPPLPLVPPVAVAAAAVAPPAPPRVAVPAGAARLATDEGPAIRSGAFFFFYVARAMACSGAKGGVSLRGRTPAKTRTTRRRAETREVAAARTAFEAAEKNYNDVGREYSRLAVAAASSGVSYSRWERSEEGRRAARAYNRAFNARQRAQEAYLDAANAASGSTAAFMANYRKSLLGR